MQSSTVVSSPNAGLHSLLLAGAGGAALTLLAVMLESSGKDRCTMVRDSLVCSQSTVLESSTGARDGSKSHVFFVNLQSLLHLSKTLQDI